jgi:transcriptional regulator with XRE-family HTH domain
MTGPRLVDPEVVAACTSYRQAVRACWTLRTRRNLTKRLLAEEVGCYPCHVTDYLHGDDKPSRRDLPAKRINHFEIACGNRIVSQWLAAQAGLTILEQFPEGRPA